MRVIERWGLVQSEACGVGCWKTDKQYMKVDETMRELRACEREPKSVVFISDELKTVMGRVCAALGDELFGL